MLLDRHRDHPHIRWMELNEFFAFLSATLAANLMTVVFLWGAFNVQKSEDARREPKKAYILAMFLPVVFGALAFFAYWLN